LALAFVGGFACCAQAAVMSATTPVTATDVRPASVQIVRPLVLPTVTTTTLGGRGVTAGAAGGSALGGRTGPSARTANVASPLGNATLTVHGQTGDAVSMAVPESFTVVRTGGTEALTVKTNTNAEYGLSQDGVVLGGAIMGGDTMSVNVGGAISLASNERATPGAYEGLLVVVVQYN
jgi:hypothetical protein